MFLEKRNGVTLCKGSSTKIKLENRQELMNEKIGAVTYLRGIVKIAVCVIVALSIVYRFMKFIQFVYKWVVLIDIVKITVSIEFPTNWIFSHDPITNLDLNSNSCIINESEFGLMHLFGSKLN